jgi:hypothetical protein
MEYDSTASSDAKFIARVNDGQSVASALLFHVSSLSATEIAAAATVIFVATSASGASAAARVAFLKPVDQLRYN